jgi:hypothetical protein
MRVCFVSASNQNAFTEELLEAFAQALEAEGVPTLRAVDHFPPPEADLVYVVVPHEYMGYVEPCAHPDAGQLRRTVVLSTRPPGTHWFDFDADVAQTAAGAVDAGVSGAAELRRRGVRAAHAPLGYVPAWDQWHGEERPRATDVMFLGGYTDRRARAVASLGPALRHRSVRLHVADSSRPHGAEDPTFLSGVEKWRALADTSLLVIVGRDRPGGVEWQAVLESMCNGCVVLTEHAVGYAPLVPGEHFFSAHPDRLALSVTALLEDPERLRRARTAAYEEIRAALPMSRAVAPLVDALATPAGGRDDEQPIPSAARGIARPRPKAPERPDPPFLAGGRSELDPIRMGVKHLVMEAAALRRELRELRGEAGRQADVLEHFGGYDRARPAITVAVTVFDYAEYVPAALRSVGLAAGRGADVELVVVDDASRDDSVQRIRETLREMPWVPSVLVRRGTNQGLAAARNVALEMARGPLVQILDADNELYPQSLDLLSAALAERPDAAFAYGALEMFDDRGPRGLMSWRAWDASALAHGNFVDAMAMVRRDEVLAVGGYTREPALHGWEDFALWCALADRGYEGIAVPAIVARYRVGLISMISMSNIDSTAAWGTLLRRYPWLAAPSSEEPLATAKGPGGPPRHG